jgi:putative oxidoreductase
MQLDPIWTGRMLSILRIITALLFLQHGLAKYFGFPHVAAFDNLKVFSLLGLAGVIEIVGSLLLLAGLFTRPAAFIRRMEPRSIHQENAGYSMGG